MRRIFFPLTLTMMFSCLQQQSASSEKALDDLARGSYIAEACVAEQPQAMVFNKSRIQVFGKSCQGSSDATCQVIERTLQTLPSHYQAFLNAVGMEIQIVDQEQSKHLAQKSFESDSVSIDNLSSFWVATTNSAGNSFLVTFVRVAKNEQAADKISYALLRTLGDFLNRGVFGLKKVGPSYRIDMTAEAALPDQVLTNQAEMARKFLGKLSQEEKSNALIRSIVDGNTSLLNAFPSDVRQSPSAIKFSRFVGTEAFHSYFCNKKSRDTVLTGRWQELRVNMETMLRSIDFYIGQLTSGSLQGQALVAESQSDMALFGGEFLEILKQFFGSNFNTGDSGLVRQSNGKTQSTKNFLNRLQPTANDDLASMCEGFGCQGCNGQCSCEGGNCSCMAGGGCCANGGQCNCVGGSCAAVNG
jgi:hypothetical protein